MAKEAKIIQPQFLVAQEVKKKKILKIKSTLFSKFVKVTSGNEFDMNYMSFFYSGQGDITFYAPAGFFEHGMFFIYSRDRNKNGFFIVNKEINTCR